MEPRLLLLLLLLTAVLTANTLAVEFLQQIPHSNDTANANATRLILTGSQITLTEEDRQALASYPQLEELDLAGGEVTRIPPHYFAVVPTLRVLSLSRNKISSLDAESFSGLDALTQLNLSHNLLTSIDARLFARLSKIEVLNLQGNPWNCSCPLLNVSEDGNKTSEQTDDACASLDSRAVSDFLNVTDECNQSATPDTTTDGPETTTTTTAVSQPLPSSHTAPEPAVTSQSTMAKDKPPGGGNSWKFTVCVIALAAGTFALILCATKGPSWYKLYHNYRHRRLREQEEDVEGWEETEGGQGGVSTVFADTRRSADNQLFTFDFHNGQTEGWQEGGEEEDEEEEEEAGEGYFEDPYFKREE
ncbi:uncharacterized protein LOC142902531 [Nelusetta ayraudi]|uniref:uncharacterized protein LOC142902531 n=1 Tax=Nelusetta ayraudi TaxID=303726 RepID=UPI003F6E88D7